MRAGNLFANIRMLRTLGEKTDKKAADGERDARER